MDKILELAKQAGFGLRFEPAKPGEPANLLHLMVEDFAKLIIQECKEAVRETYLPVLEDKEMTEEDRYWKGYVSCGVDAFCEIDIRFFGEPNEL